MNRKKTTAEQHLESVLVKAMVTTNPKSLNSFYKRFYLFIFRERRREGERKGEKHQCVVASHMLPTGDLACNPACALTGN